VEHERHLGRVGASQGKGRLGGFGKAARAILGRRGHLRRDDALTIEEDAIRKRSADVASDNDSASGR
jgi:hypothetical protein